MHSLQFPKILYYHHNAPHIHLYLQPFALVLLSFSYCWAQIYTFIAIKTIEMKAYAVVKKQNPYLQQHTLSLKQPITNIQIPPITHNNHPPNRHEEHIPRHQIKLESSHYKIDDINLPQQSKAQVHDEQGKRLTPKKKIFESIFEQVNLSHKNEKKDNSEYTIVELLNTPNNSSLIPQALPLQSIKHNLSSSSPRKFKIFPRADNQQKEEYPFQNFTSLQLEQEMLNLVAQQPSSSMNKSKILQENKVQRCCYKQQQQKEQMQFRVDKYVQGMMSDAPIRNIVIYELPTTIPFDL